MSFEMVTIIRIDEPEFGCEGRQDGITAMDKITLQCEDGERFVVEMDEQRVNQLGIDEGMIINVMRKDDGSLMIQK